MSAPFNPDFEYDDHLNGEHVPAAFSDSVAHAYSDSITTHIPLHERHTEQSITKFPVNADRYNIDWRQPLTVPRSIPVAAVNDLARNGFKQQRDEVRVAYAQRPKPSYVKANIAVIAGHATGKAGAFGTIPNEDGDERLGGGWMAQPVPLDPTLHAL